MCHTEREMRDDEWRRRGRGTERERVSERDTSHRGRYRVVRGRVQQGRDGVALDTMVLVLLETMCPS